MDDNIDVTALLTKIKGRKYTTPPVPESDNLKKEQELREHKLSNDAKQATSNLRIRMCRWVMWVVSIYLICVALIIAYTLYKQNLSDSVLIAILTTTTINILGLPLMIIISLFPKNRQ